MSVGEASGGRNKLVQSQYSLFFLSEIDVYDEQLIQKLHSLDVK